MDAVKGVLLVVRFGLELAALAALAYWGFTTGGSAIANVALGVGAPLAAIVLWALFVSPKARFESETLRLVFEVIVFGAAVLALIGADRVGWAIAFAAIAIVDGILVRVLDA